MNSERAIRNATQLLAFRGPFLIVSRVQHWNSLGGDEIWELSAYSWISVLRLGETLRRSKDTGHSQVSESLSLSSGRFWKICLSQLS